MIEVDLIKKHGKKALGMSEHGHAKPTWRQRLPEILLEIGIIVFAVTLSIQLHAWHEHSLDRAKERKFLSGLRQNSAEPSKNPAAAAKPRRSLRYFRALTGRAGRPNSFQHHKHSVQSA